MGKEKSQQCIFCQVLSTHITELQKEHPNYCEEHPEGVQNEVFQTHDKFWGTCFSGDMHILLGETFNITDCMHSACGPNGAQTLPEYHCSLDMKSRYSFCQGRGNHEPGCRQHNSETRNSSWEVKHAQKSGRCWFCISLKINGCSSLCHDSSQQSCLFFFVVFFWRNALN